MLLAVILEVVLVLVSLAVMAGVVLTADVKVYSTINLTTNFGN